MAAVGSAELGRRGTQTGSCQEALVAWLSHELLMTRMPRVTNGVNQQVRVATKPESCSESHEACIAGVRPVASTWIPTNWVDHRDSTSLVLSKAASPSPSLSLDPTLCLQLQLHLIRRIVLLRNL